jgi:hypothetical protein
MDPSRRVHVPGPPGAGCLEKPALSPAWLKIMAFSPLPQVHEARVAGAVADPRDGQLDGRHPGITVRIVVPVAPGEPALGIPGAFDARSAR